MAGARNTVDIQSPSYAVDIADKQRMYTQWMLKDHEILGMENTYTDI